MHAVPYQQAVEARALEHRWRERAEAAEAALEQSRLDMADIKADMARQHATLQVRNSIDTVLQQRAGMLGPLLVCPHCHPV